MTSGTLLESVAQSLQTTGTYAANDQEPAAAVLWPDPQGLWRPVIGQLDRLVPLLTLGPYEPETQTGPAYWIRCLLAGTLPGLEKTDGTVTVLYLPGVSRDEFRTAGSAPGAARPLIHLHIPGCVSK